MLLFFFVCLCICFFLILFFSTFVFFICLFFFKTFCLIHFITFYLIYCFGIFFLIPYFFAQYIFFLLSEFLFVSMWEQTNGKIWKCFALSLLLAFIYETDLMGDLSELTCVFISLPLLLWMNVTIKDSVCSSLTFRYCAEAFSHLSQLKTIGSSLTFRFWAEAFFSFTFLLTCVNAIFPPVGLHINSCMISCFVDSIRFINSSLF